MKSAPAARATAAPVEGMFEVPKKLERALDEVISRYPQARSATMMVLHALQEHFGHLSPEAVQWTAAKLSLEPINVLELVTFYPMFRQKPVGKNYLRICRTLSCALCGAYPLHEHVCRKLGLDPQGHGPQTTIDGRFTVEFVECLASCGTAPVIMCNDDFHESVTLAKADALLGRCK